MQSNRRSRKNLLGLSHRLPSAIEALRYELEIHFNTSSSKFSGVATIYFRLSDQMKLIPFNAKGLRVITKRLIAMESHGNSRHDIDILQAYDDNKLGYWIIEFLNPIEPGEYIIHLSFSSRMRTKQLGLFTPNQSGAKQTGNTFIATTKCEPFFAKLIFPCFDEPNKKAKFVLTISHHDMDCLVVSNMNISRERTRNNKSEVQFFETPLMSTYLFCFMILDYPYQTQTVISSLPNTYNFEIRSFARPSIIGMTTFALDECVALTEYFIRYFKCAYPLPKLDMVIIAELNSIAVQHWGIIMLGEPYVLYDRNNSTIANKQRIATLIAHELSLMWLGDLVTIKWWHNLWLCEGFATYMEYKSVHDIHRYWGMLDQFLILELYPVMAIDATLYSHALNRSVETPREILCAYDKISFSKGAAILRMMEHMVGEGIFTTIMQDFIKKFSFANAGASDFFSILGTASQILFVEDVAHTFTELSGFPVIMVTCTSYNVYKLNQRRFLTNIDDSNDKQRGSTYIERWTIPITYFTSANKTEKFILYKRRQKEHIVELPPGDKVNWIKFNKNNFGYYRVNYSVELWKQLRDALLMDHSQFSVSDRAELLSDAFALADASFIDYSVPLSLTAYLENEYEFVPWYVVLNCLKVANRLLRTSNIYSAFQEYTQNLIRPLYNALLWDSSLDHTQSLLRIAVLNAACEFGLNVATIEVSHRFKNWLERPMEQPKPDIRSIIYYYGMKARGIVREWEKVWHIYKAEKNVQNKHRLMRSLTAIENSNVLQDFLEISWNPPHPPDANYLKLLNNMVCNKHGIEVVWKHVRENWRNLLYIFGETNPALSELIPNIATNFVNEEKLVELREFLESNPNRGISNLDRTKSLDNVQFNIRWLREHKRVIENWLNLQVKTESFYSCITAMYAEA